MSDESDAPFFYANVMQAHMGAFDLWIEFGHKSAQTAQSKQFDSVCTVAMSLSHAKSMIPLLTRLIAAYETQFGQIPAPGYDEQARE